jgi:hypothetical protein
MTWPKGTRLVVSAVRDVVSAYRGLRQPAASRPGDGGLFKFHQEIASDAEKALRCRVEPRPGPRGDPRTVIDTARRGCGPVVVGCVSRAGMQAPAWERRVARGVACPVQRHGGQAQGIAPTWREAIVASRSSVWSAAHIPPISVPWRAWLRGLGFWLWSWLPPWRDGSLAGYRFASPRPPPEFRHRTPRSQRTSSRPEPPPTLVPYPVRSFGASRRCRSGRRCPPRSRSRVATVSPCSSTSTPVVPAVPEHETGAVRHPTSTRPCAPP